MDPRRFHGVHLVDAACELVLERALVIDLLGELGLAERGLVEELKARAGGGFAAQAHTRGGESGVLDLAARDADDSAVGELVGDLGVLELGHDGSHVVGAQPGERDGGVRAVADGADEEQQPDQGCADDAEADSLGAAQA